MISTKIKTLCLDSEDDVSKYLCLYRICFPHNPMNKEEFNWKFKQNPFGRATVLVAEAGDEFVCSRATLPWTAEYKGDIVKCAQTSDAMTSPAWRGRGLFNKIIQKSLELMVSEGYKMVFNFPNKASLTGNLKHEYKIIAPVAGYRSVSIFRRVLRQNGLYKKISYDQFPQVTQESVQSLLNYKPKEARTLRNEHFYLWRYNKPKKLSYIYVGNVGAAVFQEKELGVIKVMEILGDIQKTTKELRKALFAAGYDTVSTWTLDGQLDDCYGWKKQDSNIYAVNRLITGKDIPKEWVLWPGDADVS